MKEIPLTKGFIALVDDDDYVWLSEYKWCYTGGYAYNKTFGYMHRAIMEMNVGVISDKLDVDHFPDRNKFNNQKHNLRIVTRSINLHNKETKGVSFIPKTNRWRARITVNYRRIFLGNFPTFEEAAETYKGEKQKLTGEDEA